MLRKLMLLLPSRPTAFIYTYFVFGVMGSSHSGITHSTHKTHFHAFRKMSLKALPDMDICVANPKWNLIYC